MMFQKIMLRQKKNVCGISAIRMGMALLAVVLMAMNMVQLTLKQKRHDLFIGGN